MRFVARSFSHAPLLVLAVLAGLAAAQVCVAPSAPAPVFCGDAVNYNVYLNPGDTIYSLDRVAQASFLGAGTFGATACAKQAKNYVCSQVMRACNTTAGSGGAPTAQPLPACKSVCNNLLNCLQSPDAECPDEIYDDTALAASASRAGICTYIANAGVSLRASALLLSALVVFFFAL